MSKYLRWFIALAITISPFADFGFAALELSSEQLQLFNDISIALDDVEAPQDIVVGKTVRIYATVQNNSSKDQKGVVRFYNERTKQFIGTDQPFSAVAQGTDTVFIDVILDQAGEHGLAIRVLPNETTADNTENNKVVTQVVADTDFDADGTSNRNDPDDDNDGTPDRQDVFPINAAESADTDADTVGNNADPDDDNDGIPDIQDVSPQNAAPVAVVGIQFSGGGDSGFMGGKRYGGVPSAPPATGSTESNTSTNTTGSPTGSPTDPSSPPASPTPPNQTQNIPPKPKGRVGESITFDAGQSYDPDGSIQTIEWEFSDGTRETAASVEHIFTKAGVYPVKIILTDDQGEKREQIIPITIASRWPEFWGWGLGLFLILSLVLLTKKHLSSPLKSYKIRPADPKS